MSAWTTRLPTKPGLYEHRHFNNAGGRAPIPERLMFVGYVNWTEDPERGHGTTPTRFMPARLRACSEHHPLTADSLTVAEWGGEWRPAPTTGEGA